MTTNFKNLTNIERSQTSLLADGDIRGTRKKEDEMGWCCKWGNIFFRAYCFGYPWAQENYHHLLCVTFDSFAETDNYDKCHSEDNLLKL